MTKFQRLSPKERKLQICNAAKKAFMEKGFKDTTMEDIIELSTMSKGGVYYYYKNKGEIMYDIMIEGMSYRMNLSTDYMLKHENMDKEDIMVELFLDKLLDENEFKPLYAMFLLEVEHNESFKELYNKILKDTASMFMEFTRKKDMNDMKCFLNEGVIAFYNCIILGTEFLGAREAFSANRDLLKEVVKIYLRKLGGVSE